MEHSGGLWDTLGLRDTLEVFGTLRRCLRTLWRYLQTLWGCLGTPWRCLGHFGALFLPSSQAGETILFLPRGIQTNAQVTRDGILNPPESVLEFPSSRCLPVFPWQFPIISCRKSHFTIRLFLDDCKEHLLLCFRVEAPLCLCSHQSLIAPVREGAGIEQSCSREFIYRKKQCF